MRIIPIPTPRTTDLPIGNAAAGPRQALVPAAVAGPLPGPQITRPDARFVAQLIATAAHAPQTRAQLRAEIADGMTAYGKVADMMELPRPANGRTLSRVA